MRPQAPAIFNLLLLLLAGLVRGLFRQSCWPWHPSTSPAATLPRPPCGPWDPACPCASPLLQTLLALLLQRQLHPTRSIPKGPWGMKAPLGTICVCISSVWFACALSIRSNCVFPLQAACPATREAARLQKYPLGPHALWWVPSLRLLHMEAVAGCTWHSMRCSSRRCSSRQRSTMPSFGDGMGSSSPEAATQVAVAVARGDSSVQLHPSKLSYSLACLLLGLQPHNMQGGHACIWPTCSEGRPGRVTLPCLMRLPHLWRDAHPIRCVKHTTCGVMHAT